MIRQGTTLYLECNSGISGDMAVAALLDLGADRKVLEKALRSISVHGFRIEISTVKKAGLDVCDFHVILDEAHENHDHDMEYLFGEDHGGGREHQHAHHSGDEAGEHHGREHHGGEHHGGEHDHGEEAGRHHHHHHHEHRNLAEIMHIIECTDMTERSKETAGRIFEILAAAEAKAHGVSMEEVHFHEVGAVDSIVDIISVAVCLDSLGVTECIVPVLCEGSGTIRCQHGILSVPVPAVLNIVEAHQLELSVTDIKGELVTPTGAAIAAAIRTADKLPKRFRVVRSGMGGGKREYERPSILRAMLIEKLSEVVNPEKTDEICLGEMEGNYAGDDETDTVNLIDGDVKNIDNKWNQSDKNVNHTKNREDKDDKDYHDINIKNMDINDLETIDKDVIYKLETNIDDCSGEILGYVLDRLMEAGARDAHYLPAYMKKNRPAYQLHVICTQEQIPVLENIIFMETTTIGIRRVKMERSVLPRRNLEVLTELGNARVKECRLPGDGGVRYYPEYDSVAQLSRTSGKPFREVYRHIVETCRNGL